MSHRRSSRPGVPGREVSRCLADGWLERPDTVCVGKIACQMPDQQVSRPAGIGLSALTPLSNGLWCQKSEMLKI